MHWYLNLKIAAKLITGFIVVALIAGIVGMLGIINLNLIDRKDTEMYELNTVPLGDIGQVAVAFQSIRVNLRDLIFDQGTGKAPAYVSTIRALDASIDRQLNGYQRTLRTEAGRQELQNFRELRAKYQPVQEKVIGLGLANRDSEALKVLYDEGGSIAAALQKSLQTMVSQKLSLAKAKAESNDSLAAQARWAMVLVIGVGILIAIGLGLFIANLIGRPLAALTDTADRLALGDVNVDVQVRSKDETGMLTQSFAKMIVNIREQAQVMEKIAAGDLTVTIAPKSAQDLLGLKIQQMLETNHDILAGINNSAEQVASGAKQVSISSQVLSQGATEQASSLEQMTSSMSEVAEQTKQNAGSANKANELSLAVKEIATRGDDQMKAMLQAMREINDSSANIANIIKVIDEIAFQTNILALNAAVEAARAGEHGKGFAVVAEEVRNLAARSANAAQETTDLIEGSIKKVEDGTRIANQTAEALGKIIEGITESANLVANIAFASNGQATAISQINQGIEQISQVTQSNTATAEESASASEELSGQAEMLKNMVSRFKLRKTGVSGGIANLSPEMMIALEEMLSQRRAATAREPRQVAPGTAPSKTKIILDDQDFGKY